MDAILPADLAMALQKGGTASAFHALPPSHQREYLTWISEAKRIETRARRITQTIDRLGGAKDNL